jgi:hypothetical protein
MNEPKDEELLIGIPEHVLKKWISQLNAKAVDKESISKEMDEWLNLIKVA